MNPPPDRFEDNPYAAPVAEIGRPGRLPAGDVRLGEAEEIRREHISTESSIKALGLLYYLGASFLAIVTIMVFVGGLSSRGPATAAGGSRAPANVILIGTVCLVGTLFYFSIGRGLRMLSPWARWVQGILACLGLFISVLNSAIAALQNATVGVGRVAIGSGILVYVANLCLSAKGRMVFSPGYKDVIVLTPHVKNKTSIVVWLLLILMLLVIAAVAFGAIAGSFRR